MSELRDFSGKIIRKKDVDRCLHELLTKILDDSKLKAFRTDSEFLLRFLHCTEFNIPLALLQIRNYHNVFLEYPQWFASKPPSHYKKQFQQCDKIVINERDRKGRGIIILKMGKIRTDTTNPIEEVQAMEVWAELMCEDFQTKRNGICAIVDLKDFSWKLFRWFTPTNIRICIKRLETYPYTDLVIHVVSTSFLFNACMKLVWPFLSESLKRRFKFHFNNWESLHEDVDPEHLPREYGGIGNDLNFEEAIQTLLNRNNAIAQRLMQQTVSDG